LPPPPHRRNSRNISSGRCRHRAGHVPWPPPISRCRLRPTPPARHGAKARRSDTTNHTLLSTIGLFYLDATCSQFRHYHEGVRDETRTVDDCPQRKGTADGESAYGSVRVRDRLALNPQRMPRFVIQEHHARTHRFDFRLERDGTVMSWAVPKGIPAQPGTRRLAVQVNDHDVSFGDFEGVIPEGQYGAGTIQIWDRGSYEVEIWSDKRIAFTLHGQRADGSVASAPVRERQIGGGYSSWQITETNRLCHERNSQRPISSSSITSWTVGASANLGPFDCRRPSGHPPRL